jgi:hypothetical protein
MNFSLKCMEKYAQRKILFRVTKWILRNMRYIEHIYIYVCMCVCVCVATSSKQCLLQETQGCKTQAAIQVWPPKSGSYLLIVFLMMGILVPETC